MQQQRHMSGEQMTMSGLRGLICDRAVVERGGWELVGNTTWGRQKNRGLRESDLVEMGREMLMGG